MSFAKRYSIKHLVAALAISAGFAGAAHANSPTLYDKPVDGMDCTPVTMAAAAQPAKAAVAKPVAKKKVVKKAVVKPVDPDKPVVKKVYKKKRIKKPVAAAAAAPQAAAKTMYTCVNRSVADGIAPKLGLVPPGAVPQFTPNPSYHSVIPGIVGPGVIGGYVPGGVYYPPGGGGTNPPGGGVTTPPGGGETNPPGGGGETPPTDTCANFLALAQGSDGKFSDDELKRAWEDFPKLSKKCLIPPAPGGGTNPPGGGGTTPPGGGGTTPPGGGGTTPPGGTDCRDYVGRPDDQKPEICRPVHNVPEPGSLALTFLSLAAVAVSRARKIIPVKTPRFRL